MMQTTTIQSPTWLLVFALIAFAVGVAIAVRYLSKPAGLQAATPPAVPPTRKSWGWGFLGASVGLFLVVGLSYTRSDIVRVAEIDSEPAPGDSHADSGVITRTTLASDRAAPIHAPEPAISHSLLTPREQFVETFGASRLKVIAVLLVGLAALVASWRKPSKSASLAGKGPTEPKVGLGWLLIPAGCLAALGYLSAQILLPQPQVTFGNGPAIPASVQERMDKAVRDLVENASKPDSEVKNIPDWTRARPQSSNSYLLSSGQYTTREEAENELLPIAAQLLQRDFHQQHLWQGAWTVPLGQVRERVIDQQFFEKRNVTSGTKTFEMHRLHMLVNTTPEICETFVETWKTQIVERRLRVFGVLIAWLTGVLLLGRAYFWSLTLPGNAHHWGNFVKVTVVTIGLTALAGWIIVTYLR